MLASNRVTCVIPARLASTRFPRKLLINLLDKPLLEWVWESAKKVPFFDKVVFAIDSEETAKVIEGFGGEYHMTPDTLASGTDRLAYIREKGLEKSDIWVNWQGDEPFISVKMIEDLLGNMEEGVDIWTLKKNIESQDEVYNVNIAKIVTDVKNFALYFSRSPIPCYRDETDFKKMSYYKHVGLYAFQDAALGKIANLPMCPYEEAEKLEQLRFLYGGLKVKVNFTEELAFGIDLPEHKQMAESILEKILNNWD